MRSRSPLIVLLKPENPPQGIRWREAVDRMTGLFEGQMTWTSSQELISTPQEKLANGPGLNHLRGFLDPRVRAGVIKIHRVYRRAATP